MSYFNMSLLGSLTPGIFESEPLYSTPSPALGWFAGWIPEVSLTVVSVEDVLLESFDGSRERRSVRRCRRIRFRRPDRFHVRRRGKILVGHPGPALIRSHAPGPAHVGRFVSSWSSRGFNRDVGKTVDAAASPQVDRRVILRDVIVPGWWRWHASMYPPWARVIKNRPIQCRPLAAHGKCPYNFKTLHSLHECPTPNSLVTIREQIYFNSSSDNL